MYPASRPFLMFALLLAIGLRTVLGAPCCMDGSGHASASGQVAAAEHIAHAGHGSEDANRSNADHSGHGDGPSANPCCSACGPTLASDPVQFAVLAAPRILPEPAPVRSLATRPPFPAYDATGPPLRI